MKNRVLIKTVGAIMLLGTIIVTAGVGAGAASLQMEKGKAELVVEETKANVRQSEDKKEPKEESADKNQKASSGEAQLISKFETENKEDADRDQNLKVACSKINGHEIKVGETFSFIDIVGPFTEAEGYGSGPVILDSTQMGEGIGGGVCQVSTTLYNAALDADMEIVERKRHSFPMNYVSVGLDAAISTPDVDLKLKNNSDASMYMFASAEKGKVKIQLFGQPQTDKAEVKVQSVVTQELLPEGSEVRFSSTLAPGEKEVIQEERIGYEVVVYREYYKSNELIDKQVISEDTYPAIQGVVLEGSSNTNK